FAGTVYKLKQKDGEILSAMRSRATSAPVIVGTDVFLTLRADDGKGLAQESIAGLSRTTHALHFTVLKKDAHYLDPNGQGRGSLKDVAGKLDAGNGFAGGAPTAANPDAAKYNIGQWNVCTMQAFQGSRILCLNGRNFNCMGDEIIATDAKTGKKLWD